MSTLLEFVRMLVALSVVLGLVMVAARLLARVQRRQGSAAPPRSRGSRGARLLAPWQGAGGRRLAAGPRIALFGGRSGAAGPQLEVLYRRQLSRTSSLVAVRAAGKTLLLGVTAQAVQLVCELPEEPACEDGAPGAFLLDEAPGKALIAETASTAVPASAWDALLSSLRERTVRR